MAINTSAIANLLRPGLADVFGDYTMYPSQWTDIFDRHTSIMQQEIEVETRLLGMAAIRAEGASTAFDNAMGQRWITTYLHKYVSLGFIVTRQALKDNLYKNKFDMQSRALKRSMLQTKEVLGAAVINNGFSSSYPGGDGVSLYSTSHPIDGATYANTFSTQADLNETALNDANVIIQQFKDQAGLIVMTKPRKLIVPPQLAWTADRLLGSKYRTDTANNDINPIASTQMIPDGYRVNQFFTDTNGWIIKTDADSGFKYYEREKLEIDMFTEFDNDNLKVKALERYSFGWSNPRVTFGSQGLT
jgi:hypothetical protein